MEQIAKTVQTITTAVFASLMLLIFSPTIIHAASFEFSPPTGSIPSACSYEVDVIVDTNGASSNAADIEIHFDTSQVTVLDSNASIAGIQVKNGNAYDSYVYNNADNSTGIIRVAAGSLMSELVGRKTFITIKFQAKAGATIANFDIYFTGANHTLDSNVADTTTNLDLLSGVINGSYTFNSDSCEPDRIPPVIIISDPTGPTFNGILTIELDLSDNKSGVNLSTFEIIINGIVYDSSNATIVYSGDKYHYQLTIDPSIFVDPGIPTMLLVTVNDFAGNLGSSIKYLNFPTPTPTPSPSPTATATPTPTATPSTTETEEPTPTITQLPETGPSPTPCPIYTDSICKNIIDKEIEKGEYFDTKTIDSLSINLGRLNLLIPGVGLLALLSIFINLPSLLSIWLNLIAFKYWKKHLIDFIGIVTDEQTGEHIADAEVIIYDSQNLKLSDTKTDFFGRYFFDIKADNYNLVIKADNYKEFINQITYTQDNKIFHHKIAREAKENTWKAFIRIIKKIIQQEGLTFSIVAFIISLLALIFSPGLLSTIIFMINTMILITCVLLKVKSIRKYGFYS